jgi:hypothetical protein
MIRARKYGWLPARTDAPHKAPYNADRDQAGRQAFLAAVYPAIRGVLSNNTILELEGQEKLNHMLYFLHSKCLPNPADDAFDIAMADTTIPQVVTRVPLSALMADTAAADSDRRRKVLQDQIATLLQSRNHVTPTPPSSIHAPLEDRLAYLHPRDLKTLMDLIDVHAIKRPSPQPSQDSV